MNIKWAQIRPELSWHALRNEEPGFLLAYCGKRPFGPVVDDLPGTGKKCDSCDGIVLRLAEKANLL